MGANPGKEWKCLWVNETPPYIQSSVFAVQQMASVWDSQCLLEGQPTNNVLQVDCSLNNHFERGYRTCNQYPEYCDSSFVQKVTAPYQQQYVDDYARSGIHKKASNGGFFNSCYLGAYFHSAWAGTGIWNIIEIGGLSMQQAITDWWTEGNAPATSPAAWTTDCTWDSQSLEPPKWSKNTCNDWKEPGKNTTGCPPPGCTLYSMCPRPPWTNHYLCNPSCGKIPVYY